MKPALHEAEDKAGCYKMRILA